MNTPTVIAVDAARMNMMVPQGRTEEVERQRRKGGAMTVDECAAIVTREVRQAVNRAYFRKTAEPEILPGVTAALQALVHAESERCAKMVEETMRMWSHDGTFGPVLNSLMLNILRTSPGKGGG